MFKKEPFPFEKIAVAVAFSPRLEEIICEAVRLAKIFSAELFFIHIKRDGHDDIERLHALIKKYASDLKFHIVIESGDIVDSIVSNAKSHKIDLLIAGALEKESYLKYYLGSVSRKLSRKAKCSLLLIKEPSLSPKPFAKIVVNALDNPKTLPTIETAVYVSQKDESKELYVVKENELSGLATLINEDFEESRSNYKSRIISEEYAKLYALLKNIELDNVDVKPILLEGKPGYEMGHFARNINADLLIVNSADSRMGFLERFFPDELEQLLENLPTSLLIVHSRV